jgi:hypothetical protein
MIGVGSDEFPLKIGDYLGRTVNLPEGICPFYAPYIPI